MIYDRHPVTPGHILIVTRRHVSDFFDTTAVQKQAILALIDDAKLLIDASHAPQAY